MKISNRSIDKITTVIKNEPVRIHNCYFLGPVKNPVENDYLNADVNNIFKDKDIPVTEGEYIEFKNGEKVKCNFLNKFMKISPALDFLDFQIMNDERIFVINNLRCLQNKKVLIRIGKRCKIKVWINGLLVLNSETTFTDGLFIFFELEKGDNIVLAELFNINKETPISYSLKINNYYNESTGIDGELIKDYLNQKVLNKISFLQEKWNFINNSSYEFMIIPKDFINIDMNKKILIKVVDDNQELLDKFEVEYNQKVKYCIKNKNNILLTFEIFYKTISSKDEYWENVIITGNISNLILQIEEKYKLIKNKFNPSDEFKVNIEGRMKDIVNGSPGFIKSERKIIFKIIDYIQSDQHFSDFIIENKSNTVYYTSILDNQLEKYYISIPTNYSYTNKYPLVIFLSTDRYDNYSSYFGSLDDWQIIIADITGRGVTTGSYIGEASFMEIFHNITQKYNIDMDRIYLVGYSNGAYAAWALAQSHPYLFSAIVTISGVPYKENLHNLTNISILNISGEKDYLLEAGYRIPSEALTENKKYTGILLEEADHFTIFSSMYSKYIINWLLQHKRTRYPEKIYFRTERIRHKKTYWVEIYSIDKSAKYAEVRGVLENSSTICLELTGVSQFILTIPDRINKDNFIVIINENNTFSFNNITDENQLYFKKFGNSYALLKNIKEMKPQRNSMGMGILDIYMDSLKIITPAINNSEEGEIINSIAQNFAKPVTRGWDPVIYVDHPVISEDIHIMDDHEKYNFILIGCKSNNKTILKMQDKLPIKFDDHGYEYMNNYTEEDYCILILCSNPINENKKILLLYANSYTILNKCVFNRKLFIPSYSNGFHPFLNNEAIIYNGNNYLVIDVIGNNITKLV